VNCEQTRDLITAFVDNEVSETERASVDDHLRECAKCRRAYDHERALKREIHKIGISMTAPADLKRKILADHGVAPRKGEFFTAWGNTPAFTIFRKPAFGLAAVLVALLAVAYLLIQPNSQPTSIAALEIQEKIARGELSLRRVTNQSDLRDWQTRAVNGEFAPMAYDFSAIGLQPVGGLVHDIDGRKALVTVYSGEGQSITCFTFLSKEEDAPNDAKVFFDQARNVRFYAFSRNGYNAVLHREGNVICLLASKMPAQELLAVARAT
jgi:anti-sigma factor (TIGR02949 family)